LVNFRGRPTLLPALSLEGRIEGSQSEGSSLRVGSFPFLRLVRLALRGVAFE